MNQDTQITETAAKVLVALVQQVMLGSVSINRGKLAEGLGLTPAQLSRSLKELEQKEAVYYGAQGHLFLSEKVLSSV